MNILTITKESFAIFFKHIHWFALYLLPLPTLLYSFGFDLGKIQIVGPITLLTLAGIIVTVIVVLVGLIMLERIKQKEGLGFKGVAGDSSGRFLSILGVNLIWAGFFILVGIGASLLYTYVSPSQTFNQVILAFVVAGILFMIIKYALAQTLVVTEKCTAIGSFSRSAQLMDGHKLAMFGLLLVLVVIFALFAYAYNQGMQAYLHANMVEIMAAAKAEILFDMRPIVLVYQIFTVLLTQLALIHVYIFYQKRILIGQEPRIELSADTRENSDI